MSLIGRTESGSGEYSSYYETGSISAGTRKIHIRRFVSRRKAFEDTAALSLSVDGYVTVNRNGLEIASFYRGEKR